jgi:hypothetical protein
VSATATLEREQVEAPARGKPTTHGACGQSWRQVGNQTGHCSGCHRTFASGRAFDRHQRIVEGRSVCTDPASLTRSDRARLYASAWDGLATVWSIADHRARGADSEA